MQLKINFYKNKIEECLLDNFTNWMKYNEQMSDSSIYRYMSTIRRVLTSIQFENELHVRKFLIDYIKEHKAADGRYTKFVLIKYLKFLHMDYKVLEDIKTKKEMRKRFDVLCPNEFELLLDVDWIDRWSKYRYRNNVLMTLLWTTGLRISEALNLRHNDLIGDQLFIRNGKGMKEAYVFCHSYVKEFIVLNTDPDDLDGFVFMGKSGKQLNKSSVNESIKKRVSAAGIKKNISAHSFRRSFATNLISQGINIVAVQEFMRHEDPATTAKYVYMSKQTIHDMWKNVFK